ncbi:MAG: response regulator [Acidobacteria bacterium]|nr:response regulator [Acidobacteriota bacterium]
MAAEAPATILVADDNRPVRELLRDTFAAAGFRVLTAANGREALDRVAEERPDLVITDVAMPEMDGWALCEALQADPLTRDLPLVFLASQREVPDRLRGLQGGAYDYLCKPFSTEELLVRVRLILARTRLGVDAGEGPRAQLSGHTSHLPIADLLQLLTVNGKTGCLRLRAAELGRIHLREGRIIEAFTSRTRGKKALYRIIGWNDAEFHFDPEDDPQLTGELGQPDRLVMDALVALDEIKRVAAQLPSIDAPLGRGPGPAETRDAAEEDVARLAAAGASLRELLDGLERTDDEIAQALLRLLERQVIAPRL